MISVPERLLAAYRQGNLSLVRRGAAAPVVVARSALRISTKAICTSRAACDEQLRRSTAEVRFNTAFAEVIRACAAPRRYRTGTWITDDMIVAYERLHRDWLGAFDRGLAGRRADRRALRPCYRPRRIRRIDVQPAARMRPRSRLLVLDRRLSDGTFGVHRLPGAIQPSAVAWALRAIPRIELRRDCWTGSASPPMPFKNWPNRPDTCA